MVLLLPLKFNAQYFIPNPLEAISINRPEFLSHFLFFGAFFYVFFLYIYVANYLYSTNEKTPNNCFFITLTSSISFICLSYHSLSPSMVAQEQYVDPVEENTDFEDPYEAEETLSLCDLPSYSDASNWDDNSKEDQSLSSDSNDFFEFFSEDFTASTCSTTAANKSIIFCGKLIPYKELPDHPEKPHQNQEKQNHTCKKGVFRWKSLSFNKTRSSSKGSKLFRWKSLSFNKTRSSSPKGSKGKKVYKDKNSSKGSIASASASPASKSYVYKTSKCDLSMGKVTMLTSPTKSRWYLLIFGMTRFTTEMELRDIKIRQSRIKSPSMMFRSVECDNMVKSNERCRRKGLWRLIKILGSRSQHLNAVVKASFGCIPSTRVS